MSVWGPDRPATAPGPAGYDAGDDEGVLRISRTGAASLVLAGEIDEELRADRGLVLEAFVSRDEATRSFGHLRPHRLARPHRAARTPAA